MKLIHMGIALLLFGCAKHASVGQIYNGNQLETAIHGRIIDIDLIMKNDSRIEKVCGKNEELFLITKESIYYGKRDFITDCNIIEELKYIKRNELVGTRNDIKAYIDTVKILTKEY